MQWVVRYRNIEDVKLFCFPASKYTIIQSWPAGYFPVTKWTIDKLTIDFSLFTTKICSNGWQLKLDNVRAGYIFWEKMIFLTNVSVRLSDLDCVMCQHYPPSNSLLLYCNSGMCQEGVMWTFEVITLAHIPFTHIGHLSIIITIIIIWIRQRT